MRRISCDLTPQQRHTVVTYKAFIEHGSVRGYMKLSVSCTMMRTMMRRSILLLMLPDYLEVLTRRNHEEQQYRPTQALSGSINSQISRTRGGYLASAAEDFPTKADSSTAPLQVAPTTATVKEPFVDNGMFDPRRDYWSKFNRTGARSTTSGGSNRVTGTQRSLASVSSNCGPASSSDPCCIECFGLSYCDVLNGYKVEDKYFPGEATILGSCENFEDRASRLEVFGPSKTFRDTDACREMVTDYTCLWWGSENVMYDNRCGIEAQVYPCRSYCVQLAKTCANNVVEWQELCRSIDCPPTDEECMPGPYTQDPDEACYLYEYHSPLNATPRRALPFSLFANIFVGVVAAMAMVIAEGVSM